MSKLTRFFHRVFGSGANSTQMAVFGSYKNGATQMTTDASTVASLANWLVGLPSGVVGKNAPIIEEVNGALFHTSRQVAYLLQQGIAEYNSETEYYTDSYVTANNLVYRSIRDNHIGYPVTSLTTWKIFPDSSLPSYATTTAYTTVRPLEEGAKFYNSTTKRFMSYLNSLWNYDDENTIIPSYATTTAFTTARGGPVEGNKFYDTTLLAMRYYLGGAWIDRFTQISNNPTSLITSTSVLDVPNSNITLTHGRWKIHYEIEYTFEASTTANSYVLLYITLCKADNTVLSTRYSTYKTSTTVANLNSITAGYMTSDFTVSIPYSTTQEYKIRAEKAIVAGSVSAYVANYDSIIVAERII